MKPEGRLQVFLDPSMAREIAHQCQDCYRFLEVYEKSRSIASKRKKICHHIKNLSRSSPLMSHAVILTALPVEYLAVRAHLKALQEEVHAQGTIYERGIFSANGREWEVGIVEIGAGNVGAALEAERAIAHFKPDVILFVGVAGGIKDVAIGDVVASTKIYGYESGKAEERFKPRPEIGLSAYNLEQRARAEARKGDWLSRLAVVPEVRPRVFVGPIAAGEKVIVSTQSEVFQFLRENYGDAIAVEMEGLGFLEAARVNQKVSAIVVRGISDLIDGKGECDRSGSQILAASHASAFALEVIARYNVVEVMGSLTPPNNILESLNNIELVQQESIELKDKSTMAHSNIPDILDSKKAEISRLDSDIQAGGGYSQCSEILLIEYANLKKEVKQLEVILANTESANSEFIVDDSLEYGIPSYPSSVTFIDRPKERERIEGIPKSSDVNIRIIVIQGMGGTGKTFLATQTAKATEGILKK